MRRLLPIALVVGLAAMAAVALAQVGGAPPARAAAIASSGSFEITDSNEGAPIFAAAGIAPGESTSGTVTIKDAGSAAITLKLHRGELVDTPGVAGGALSGRLELTVVDVTEPTAPRTVYSGPLDSMPDISAGELAGGDARTYRFTATLPDSGTASFQNAVQGASTTVAYSWIAGEAGGGGGGGGGESGGGNGGGGGTGGGSTGTGNPSPPDEGTPVPRVLDLIVPKVKRAIRGGRLVVWTNCDMTCRLTVRGRLRATVAGNHRGARIRFTRKTFVAPGPHRLRIPIPHRLRRWIATTPGKARVRVKLRVFAVGTAGERDTVRKTVRLRARRPAPPPNPGETPPQADAPG
jgi:hypothetical protein